MSVSQFIASQLPLIIGFQWIDVKERLRGINVGFAPTYIYNQIISNRGLSCKFSLELLLRVFWWPKSCQFLLFHLGGYSLLQANKSQ